MARPFSHQSALLRRALETSGQRVTDVVRILYGKGRSGSAEYTSVCRWVNGGAGVPPESLRIVSEAFGINPEDLVAAKLADYADRVEKAMSL